MTRTIFIGVSVVVASICIWYLAIRPYDLRVRFKAETIPKVVMQTFKTWASNERGQLDSLNLESFSAIQGVELNERRYTIHWSVKFLDDSTSLVKADFNAHEAGLSERVKLLFSEALIEKDAKSIVQEFFGKLREHLSKINVQVIGEQTIEEMYCVCVPLKTNQLGKAMGMMSNYSFLSDFILTNGLKPTGVPLVSVNVWDEISDKLEYEFCFPIEEQQPISHPSITFKRIDEQRGIVANYFGNYITSDRAWYALMHFASERNLEIEEKPIEFFYSNPNFEADQRKWKAEIFMPLK